ncbi:MAG TPA: ABC-F family ATP-binding cassette domain-containing protein [Puia sp.]|nr:ABC-F family ATP-binding cassette domain-containing protein [Puia sp.]
MHYVSAESLTKAYGIKPLFQQISFNIEEGDKIALVARNGTGKTTLLKILAGKEFPDEGKLWVNREVTVALFEQDPLFADDKSIIENLFHHDHPVINAIREFESIGGESDVHRLTAVMETMDKLDAWDFDHKVKQILSVLNIHHLHQPVGALSGGQRKRVALARTLIDIGFKPGQVLLIMDEPTNHLDIDMVEWLENFLASEKITLLLVTHDRYFLDTVCEEIWELDGGSLYVYKGDYDNYLEKKSARIDSDLASIDKARNLYRKELDWMRRQPKARTTKSKSRQDNFYAIESKAKQQVEDPQLSLQLKMSRLGGKIAEFKKVNKSFSNLTLLKGFDYTFKKGEKLGIIGKNGVGKSTLVNMLMGIEQPDSGKVNVGETVIFGNYAQQGLQIKEDMRVIEYVKTIAENFPLAEGGSLSASQFLQLFLFSPDQQYAYVSSLSGGEKRRLHLLSILFRNPNFLVLDEPTNDLDLPTLGVLENFLAEFQGCIVVISHDRYFMDRLVDHILVMEGEGRIRDFPGNYSQYRQEVAIEKGEEMAPVHSLPKSATGRKDGTAEQKKRRSYKEQREFEQLEKEISDLGREKIGIAEKLALSTLPYEELDLLSTRIGEISRLLDEKEMRWLELSEFPG